jgi:hypothetical protein
VHSQPSRRLSPRPSASPKASGTHLGASPKLMSRSPLAGSFQATSSRPKTPGQTAGRDDDKASDDDSSPLKPPPKKAKAAHLSSSESDSEAERKAHVAQLKGNVTGSGGAAKRGVRQPIKRGGKRF